MPSGLANDDQPMVNASEAGDHAVPDAQERFVDLNEQRIRVVSFIPEQRECFTR